jgi:hypothetical protein
MENLEASMVFSPNANRHSTEFAAKAISAMHVEMRVLINMYLRLSIN